MPTVRELPDPMLLKIAEKVRNEILKRGLHAATSDLEVKKLVGEWRESNPAIVEAWDRGRRCSPLDAPVHPAPPCNGRSASEQLNHARRISDVANHWARRLGWSDDFMLMLDVARCTRHTLVFTISAPISVTMPSYETIHLQVGDTLEVKLIDGTMMTKRIQIDKTERVNLDLDPIWRDKMLATKRRVDCMQRHPFAVESDVDAILKWEDSQPKVDEVSCKGRSFPCGHGCAVAMFWQESREAIKGNVSVVLNVAGLLAILLVEAGWAGLLWLWVRSVPSDRTQWNMAANALHFDGYSEDEIIAQIGECPKDE